MSNNNPSKKPSLPPDQKVIGKILRWGIDHPRISRTIPKIDRAKWALEITGQIKAPVILRWDDFISLPRISSISNFHCVEGWSVLDCNWEGVRFDEIIALVQPHNEVISATFRCYDGYSTSLTLKELAGGDVILAYRLNGKDLEPELGGPMRLIVPSKYAYKSAMWINKITFTSAKERGYWENKGYSDSADVWKNDRYSF